MLTLTAKGLLARSLYTPVVPPGGWVWLWVQGKACAPLVCTCSTARSTRTPPAGQACILYSHSQAESGPSQNQLQASSLPADRPERKQLMLSGARLHPLPLRPGGPLVHTRTGPVRVCVCLALAGSAVVWDCSLCIRRAPPGPISRQPLGAYLKTAAVPGRRQR